MLIEVCVCGAYSFVSKKLRVSYEVLDVYRVTAGVVKVSVGFLCKVVMILSCLI